MRTMILVAGSDRELFDQIMNLYGMLMIFHVAPNSEDSISLQSDYADMFSKTVH